MAEVLVNSAEALAGLTAKVSASATSLPVNRAAPEALWGAEFRVRVDDELMLVTATGADGASPWTVERNVEPMVGGSGAAAHASGAKVSAEMTVGGLEGASDPKVRRPRPRRLRKLQRRRW
jgi:hypothetical protein